MLQRRDARFASQNVNWEPRRRGGFAILSATAIWIFNLLLAPARQEQKEHRPAIMVAAVER
jgi:hypothetical protein